jgi:hypothetical protein
VHLRGVSPEVERLAKVEAARRGMSLSAFVSMAIEAVAAKDAHDRNAARPSPFAVERTWFEEREDELRAAYPGKMIAILGQEVVDSGDTLPELARRLQAKYGMTPVFVVDLTEDRRPRLAPPISRYARGAA